ncbi:universal stress protein [Paraburkholderia sp. BCC1885]|uniref:universal stress protein n=1 Tax=Paraburkholderia sp. BCC1885 TaxID=2562669 RepID=UPI0011845217|nr:universal stress protein [Paraburkholderia sp. BCC1885]
MSYKTIVVHLDTSRHAHARLEMALQLAKHFGAHLVGVFAVFNPDPRAFYVMAGSAEYFAAQDHLRLERSGALERLFHAELKRAELAGEWVAVDQAANLTVPHRGHYADLVIAGQEDPHDPESYVGDYFSESLVMSAGRPVLLAPYAANAAAPGGHVMVCWDGSREATRVVHDALPFMRTARLTTIVSVNGEPGQSRVRIPGADIATVIARHGIRVEVKNLDLPAGRAVGDMLLSQANTLGADLLVMGAYGHARWQELVMGGATRTILKSMTLPVLMSH